MENTLQCPISPLILQLTGNGLSADCPQIIRPTALAQNVVFNLQTHSILLYLLWHLVMYFLMVAHVWLFAFIFYYVLSRVDCKLLKSHYMYVFRLLINVLNELNLDATDDSWNLEICTEHTFECITALLFISQEKEVLIGIVNLLLISLCLLREISSVKKLSAC